MYKIINSETGDIVGYTQSPYWIKRRSTGVFVKAKNEEDAQGIAYISTPYNLRGRDGVGVNTTVFLIEFDGGELLLRADETADNVAAIEDALCEQDGELMEEMAAIENALCELDVGEEDYSEIEEE